MDNCIFCKIIQKEIPAQIVYEDDQTLAFLDIKPTSNGHVLVIPKIHAEDLIHADANMVMDIARTVHRIAPGIIKAVSAQGFNVNINNGSVAGQVVMHTHWHIIPRFEHDGLTLWHGHDYEPGQADMIAQAIREQL